MGAPCLVNFIAALAYHFYLNLRAAFTQPGARFLALPCTHTLYNVIPTSAGGSAYRRKRAAPKREEKKALSFCALCVKIDIWKEEGEDRGGGCLLWQLRESALCLLATLQIF